MVVIAILLKNEGTTEGPSSSSLKQPDSVTSQKGGEAISYKVLRSWTPKRAGTGMDILVSPSATKDEVMDLAKKLLNDFGHTGTVVIFIFDLKEAWENWDNYINDRYPAEKFLKHHLVQVTSPPSPAGNTKEIIWIAEGREDPIR